MRGEMRQRVRVGEGRAAVRNPVFASRRRNDSEDKNGLGRKFAYERGIDKA